MCCYGTLCAQEDCQAQLFPLPALEDEKLLSLLCCPGPAVRTPELKAGRQASPACMWLIVPKRGKAAEEQVHSTPREVPHPRKEAGVGWRHPVFPCPSLAPYLAILLAAPSPSLHGLGAPR